jgi:hypothetical protein
MLWMKMVYNYYYHGLNFMMTIGLEYLNELLIPWLSDSIIYSLYA